MAENEGKGEGSASDAPKPADAGKALDPTPKAELKGASKDAGKKGGPSAADAIKNPKKAAGAAATSAAMGAAEKAAGQAMPEGAREAVDKTRQVAEKAVAVKSTAAGGLAAGKGFIAAIAAIFGNPVGWICLALVVLIILVYSGMLVLGRTDNADGCYGVGGDSANNADVGDASGDWLENGATVADWLTSTSFETLGGNPMTTEQAVAVIGNMKQESGVMPDSTQGGFTPPDTSNEDIIALGTVGGKAIGLLQFDSDRRLALAEYAQDEGKHWSDFSLQLDWILMEIEGTAPEPSPEYNRDQLLAHNFDSSDESVDFYVEAWEKGFTRAGKPMLSERIAFAKEFQSSYTPGSGAGLGDSSSGGSCLKDSGGSVDTSDAVQLAVSMSYPTSEESKVSAGDSYGENQAKQEYKDAKAEAEKLGDGPDPLGALYASCDRFVTAVVRLTMDEEIPWGDTSTQGAYLEGSPKWEQYTKKSEAEPGDIWVTKSGGHIIFYVGDHEGQDTIAHASYLDRVAALGSADYLNEDLVDQSGRPYYGYRFVG